MIKRVNLSPGGSDNHKFRREKNEMDFIEEDLEMYEHNQSDFVK